MYYVYVLISLKDLNFYVGSTNDLKRRFLEHNSGKNVSTKNRIPFKMVCYEAYLTRAESYAREKYLKSNDGRKELKIRLKITLKKYLEKS